jgi:hypothetical protein
MARQRNPGPVDHADLTAISGDDLAWAKPYVDEARAAAARGEKTVSLDEAVSDITALKR